MAFWSDKYFPHSTPTRDDDEFDEANSRTSDRRETGLPQQLELFESLHAQGESPIVLDSKDILQNPRGMLSTLCKQLGISFYEEMLSWPSGKRSTDGIWAPHWYTSVEASTGFAPWRHKDEQVPTELESMCVECEKIYAQLASHKMTVEGRDHASNI